MSEQKLTLICVGDIILGNSAERYFESVLPVLDKGDVVMGQLEVPYTARSNNAVKLERHPDNLKPLVDAGFDVLTLAGNHIFDEGSVGIEDTIRWLDENNVNHVGAGMNLAEAKEPVIIEEKGLKLGILKYNCVGPVETWASEVKAGCAYVDIITHYRLDHANPGGPPTAYTFAEPNSLQNMKNDIEQLRSKCDYLIVSFHKGLVHQPVKIADYEKEVSYAAIDAGADLVVGEHSHLLKGIEFYKNKPIYHGLNNFIAYVPSLRPDSDKSDDWAERRIELFGFTPDPNYPTYPFHPEAIYTIIASVNINDNDDVECRFTPCIVNREGVPIVVNKESGGQEVFDYMKKITEKANLNAKYVWKDNDEILVIEKD